MPLHVAAWMAASLPRASPLWNRRLLWAQVFGSVRLAETGSSYLWDADVLGRGGLPEELPDVSDEAVAVRWRSCWRVAWRAVCLLAEVSSVLLSIQSAVRRPGSCLISLVLIASVYPRVASWIQRFALQICSLEMGRIYSSICCAWS